MANIVQVIDLVKNYYLESITVRALRGVTLKVEEGDFVALMGPSGSGKSTLLNLLGCLDRPTSGQYYLGDEDVSGMDDDQLSEVRSRYLGFIFQSYNLLAQYTVVENVEVPRRPRTCPPRSPKSSGARARAAPAEPSPGAAPRGSPKHCRTMFYLITIALGIVFLAGLVTPFFFWEKGRRSVVLALRSLWLHK